MTPETAWKLEHPTEKLSYAPAIVYVERWLNEKHLTEEERAANIRWSVYDYLDKDAARLIERPWLGVRVSEVSVAGPSGGGSYMQVDVPWGVAFCGQVERCVIALIECWNEGASADGPNYGETDEEFWRLGNLIEAVRATA